MATKRKKRADGNYAIRRKVAPYKDKNGNIQEYKTFYGKTVKEATDKFNAYTAGADKSPVFFDDEINAWISGTFLTDPKYAPGTKQRYVDAYRANMEQLPITKKQLKDITYKDIQAAYNSMTCKPSSVRNVHKLLRLFFALMVNQRVIEVDPTNGVSLPAIEKKTDPGEIITFTDEEIARIKKYICRTDLPYYEQQRADRFRLLVLLLIHTGARISELLALTYDDISADQISISKQVISRPTFKDGKTAGHDLVIDDTKTGNAVRTIPISESIYKEFEAHRARHKREQLKHKYRTGYVFTTRTGQLIDKHSVRHSLDRIHASAGVPCYGLHAYRRTFATRLAKAGTPIQVLADLLGHGDISITAKYYIGISDDEKKKAIAKL